MPRLLTMVGLGAFALGLFVWARAEVRLAEVERARAKLATYRERAQLRREHPTVDVTALAGMAVWGDD